MIEKDNSQLSVSRQCELLGIHRSGLYYQPCPESEGNLQVMRLIDEVYLDTPFYGVWRLKVLWQQKGHLINCKRVKRLMDLVGWQTIYRAPRTSLPEKKHKVYPYLLRGLEITRPNQVWATDITYSIKRVLIILFPKCPFSCWDPEYFYQKDMEKYKSYKAVQVFTLRDLNSIVNNHLKEGWELMGGVSSISVKADKYNSLDDGGKPTIWFSQALVNTKENAY